MDYYKITTTCTTNGVKTFTCANDKTHTYTESVAKIPHSYNKVVTAPTCKEKGYTTYITEVVAEKVSFCGAKTYDGFSDFSEVGI